MGKVISFNGKVAAFSMRKLLQEGLNTCLWQTGGSFLEKDAALVLGYCTAAMQALKGIGDPLCAEMFEDAITETRRDWRNYEHVMRNLSARLMEYPVEAKVAEGDD